MARTAVVYDMVFVFFFQAEDGIRDKLVTGVQTCALPISTLLVQLAQPLVGRSQGGGFFEHSEHAGSRDRAPVHGERRVALAGPLVGAPQLEQSAHRARVLVVPGAVFPDRVLRSEEHTSEL